MSTGQEVASNNLYAIEFFSEPNTLVHNWRSAAGTDIPEFKEAVIEFAAQCSKHQPARAIFDARPLDPDGRVVGWISGRETPEGEEAYGPWWMREIVSVYNKVGLISLAIATGDPNAGGELPESPPGCEFKMGFFPDLQSAMVWLPH